MDAYEKLGLESGAHEKEIRAAYRRLAREYHPDRFATAQADIRMRAQDRMSEINIAFEILTDPEAASRHRHSEIRRDAAMRRRPPAPGAGTVYATSAGTAAPRPGTAPSSPPTTPPTGGFDYRRDASSEFDVASEAAADGEDSSSDDLLFTMQKGKQRGGFFRRK